MREFIRYHRVEGEGEGEVSREVSRGSGVLYESFGGGRLSLVEFINERSVDVVSIVETEGLYTLFYRHAKVIEKEVSFDSLELAAIKKAITKKVRHRSVGIDPAVTESILEKIKEMDAKL